VEAAGHGLTGLHAASIAGWAAGVLHGNRTYLLMTTTGRSRTRIHFRRLDYPGRRPRAFLAA
jgi:tryptophan synthase beta chain